MGIEIDRDRFADEEYERFSARLASSLDVLETLLARPGFGAGATTIGAELEIALIDERHRPLPLNVEVLAETLDPRMTVELDRFNLECNLDYGPLAGRPFSALRLELDGAEAELERAAHAHGGRIAKIGILPTIIRTDLTADAMTDTMRYRALSYALRRSRNAPFHLDIDGDEPLRMDCEAVTFEGAATSLQVHVRVAPADFADLFNAFQAGTAPLLAISGNSPFFVGHRLWAETRVALFKQAVDERDANAKADGRRPRVGFGRGWVREGALELFREAVETFAPLLPVLDAEEPAQRLADGGIPRLREIRLHQGTVWDWNRPVYDPAGGGHLRIELRALPSGPSNVDMLANIAFAVGLGFGLRGHADEIRERMDFEWARSNFYRAAQEGADAQLQWPDGLAGVEAPGDVIDARSLARGLLPIARLGLERECVESSDSEPLLEVVRQRAESGRTGAWWQREMLSQLSGSRGKEEALRALVGIYLDHSRGGRPVHEWPTRADG